MEQTADWCRDGHFPAMRSRGGSGSACRRSDVDFGGAKQGSDLSQYPHDNEHEDHVIENLEKKTSHIG